MLGGGVLRWSLSLYALLNILSRFATILTRKKELLALLLLSFRCLFCYGLWLFLMMPWVGLGFVIVVFPDHTHFVLIQTVQSMAGVVAVKGHWQYVD